MLDELLDREIIRCSDLPYATPIVLARKKDGSLRLCVNYRQLNKITVSDNFLTKLMDDRLKGKKYFTILDLKDDFIISKCMRCR